MENLISISKDLFPIVPLFDNSKIPNVKWSDRNCQIKTKEEFENISSRAYKKEITGISLLTGKHSNIIVIDIDKNHGDGSVDGEESFEELIKDLSKEDKQQINNTFAVKTPNGGTHLYFKYKKGLKNKANYAPGVDIRTDGGLIVLPGSKVNVNDEIREYQIFNNTDINEMPQSLFDKFIQLGKPVKKKTTPVEAPAPVVNSTYKEGARNQELFKEVIGIVSKSSIRDIQTITSIAKGLNLFKCNPPLDDGEVTNIIGSIVQRLNPPYCDKKGNVINYLLVEKIIKEQPSYTKGNLWFMYDNKKGFYKYMEFREVQKMYFQYAINDSDKTVVKSKNFAELLMLNSEYANEVNDEKKYINCLNGVIDIEKNTMLPHDPKYKTEVQFKANLITDPTEYKKVFDKSEFKKFLNSTLDEESIKTLQEAWGLMLSPHAREVQNCFIYKGEGSNGKSVTFDIQEALIEENNHICSIGLGDFGETFAISVAEGKHVNIVRDDELSGKTVSKAFKSMCCGEPVTVNRKNKDLVRLGFNMTMFFGLNRLPSAADKSTGFFRRPVIIPFNNSFGTEKEVAEGIRDKVKDPKIAERIIENELDIVFTWAYAGLNRVKNNNWKVTVSAAAEQEMEEYREEVDSSYAFFKEKITKVANKNIKIPKSEVYKVYNNWCISNNIMPMNPTHLGRQLSSFGIKHIKSNSIGYYLDIEIDDLEPVPTQEYIFKK
ncbi:MAG: phage/plasmid primase, P4 family [Clostridium beijerinckii]|jgi:P4 family phage/plasmid primase-like protien|nr:phage/plasmid primase, P4 family [Clostridium beijerinckii]MCI1580458.1 phage/plasmid primase, P4 family [Clostridium beijerinckii]MCI1584932.1 phage/plasmid primase, P4 family [Clostridium beijerinckii]MCI1623735.1 phage/plasmid primase, P4 family [Clostridium beijerinckii]